MEEYPSTTFDNISNIIFNDDRLDDSSSLNINPDSDSLSYLLGEINNERHQTNNNYLEKPKIFNIKKKKTPGRKRQKAFLKKKRHCSNDNDNILCKIHIHFFNFLVNFANDAIKIAINNTKERKHLAFKYIDHRIKKQISKKHLKNLITQQIKDILQLRISKKYSKFSKKDEYYNQNIYNGVIALSDWLGKLFSMDYLDAFKLYYNDCKPLTSFEFGGKVIQFSEETKSFAFLYNKAKKNEIKLRLKFIAEEYYLQLGNQSNFKGNLFIEL